MYMYKYVYIIHIIGKNVLLYIFLQNSVSIILGQVQCKLITPIFMTVLLVL